LSHNQLAALPPSLSSLSSLGALRLSHNALTTPGIPWAALGALSGLTMLLLDHNQLEVLPAALGGLRQLVVLGAGDNCLGCVEEGALGPALQQVDLARNHLPALPEDLGEGAQGLGRVGGREGACPGGMLSTGAVPRVPPVAPLRLAASMHHNVARASFIPVD
jgi:Leucine-rich repeat (LRR) protein